jgi:hypothetical protein
MPVSSDIREILLACEVGQAILAAVDSLLDRDAYLLKADANERSISHRLGMYLEREFPDFNVDCEYNRDGIEPKKLPRFVLQPDSQDTDAKTVFPDIIVHRRATNDDNLLVVEIKKTSNGDEREHDRRKLRGYKSILGYQYALFLELTVGGTAGVATVEWVDA